MPPWIPAWPIMMISICKTLHNSYIISQELFTLLHTSSEVVGFSISNNVL